MTAVPLGQLPDSVVLPLDKIEPYWRNPRRIPEEAVEAVRSSIDLFGYVQPIVVDPEHVIVVGHTRHQALIDLGVSEVPVYVMDLPEKKVREYRLIDNRTGEMTAWDQSALVSELREWEAELREAFFPDVDLEVGALQDALTNVTPQDIADATRDAMAIRPPGQVVTTDVVCPACLEAFQVRTDSLPGVTTLDLEVLAAGSTDDDGRAE
jgi:hypothetical protein